MGEMLSGTYGSIWTHGVYIAGHFVPGSLTYLHSIVEVRLDYGMFFLSLQAMKIDIVCGFNSLAVSGTVKAL